MPTSSFTHPLFGLVGFRTAHSTWVRGDSITFTSGFDPADVTPLLIPQLVGIPPDSQGSAPGNGRYMVHKRAHKQFQAAFQDIETLGLLPFIRSCAGSFNMRLKRPTSGALSKTPSNHSFGIAIDLNSDDGSNGGSVRPMAPCFTRLGFRWGITFNDPMHFEVETFIDSARPNVARAVVMLHNNELQIGGLNAFGHVVVPVLKVEENFAVTRITQTAKSIKLASGSTTKTMPLEVFGDRGFVRLSDVAALLGLSISWDNATKTATLT